jgi:hypothetical protein
MEHLRIKSQVLGTLPDKPGFFDYLFRFYSIALNKRIFKLLNFYFITQNVMINFSDIIL